MRGCDTCKHNYEMDMPLFEFGNCRKDDELIGDDDYASFGILTDCPLWEKKEE